MSKEKRKKRLVESIVWNILKAIAKGIWFILKSIGKGIAFIAKWAWKGFIVIVTWIAKAVREIAAALNIIPNFQWRSHLNIFQNIALNSYLPASNGQPSMHSTVLAIVILLLVSALGLEIHRFAVIPTYNFSTGFYAILGSFAILVKLVFSKYERVKLKNGNDAVKKEDTQDEDIPITIEDVPANRISKAFLDKPKKSKKKRLPR